MSLPSIKTNVRLVKNEEGKWCYPASQRSDGTWRKPILVRDSYDPAESEEKYICRGRREANAAASLANIVIKQEPEILEEDTTDFGKMDRKKKDETPSSSTPKTSGSRAFSMPRMDQYWTHMVPVTPDPVKPQAPPTSATSAAVNHEDEFDGPVKMDKTSADNSWNSPTSQDVSTVPVVNFEEKCLNWQNMEQVSDKLSTLTVSEKKKVTATGTRTLNDERSLAVILDLERKADIEDFERLVNANELSPPDYVNSWNYLVAKWLDIQQMLGVASREDIIKMTKSKKLMF